MSIFKTLKQQIAKYSKDPDLLSAPQQENNSVESAANLAKAGATEAANVESSSANLFGAAIEKSKNALTRIKVMQGSINQYKTNEAIKNINMLTLTAKSQISNVGLALSSNPKDKDGRPYNMVDLNSQTVSSVRDSMNGMINGVKGSLSKESVDYLNSYADYQSKKLHQFSLNRQYQFSIDSRIGAAKGALPSVIKSAQLLMIDPDTRAQGIQKIHDTVNELENLEREATTPAQAGELAQMASKLVHYQGFAQSVSKYNVQGPMAKVTYNYLASGAASQQKSLERSVLLGENPEDQFRASSGKAVKNAAAMAGAAESLHQMKTSSNIPSTIAQMGADDGNSSHVAAHKLYSSLLMRGKGLQVLEAVDPGQADNVKTMQDSELKMTAAKENLDSDGYAQAATSYNVAKSKILASAHSRNIPLDSINGVTPRESSAINSIVYGSTEHDKSGNITAVHLDTYNDNNINSIKEGMIDRHGQPVLGNSFESKTAKYIRYMQPNVAHSMSGSDISTNILSFNPKIQQFANKLDVFRDKDGKLWDHVSNIESLSRKIRTNASDFHLNQTAVMTGISIDDLSKQTATHMVLLAGNKTITNKTQRTLKQAYDRVKNQSSNMVDNMHVYSGSTNGIGYTIDPSTSQSYFPGEENSSHVGELSTHGAHAAYDRYIRGLSIHPDYNKGDDKLAVLTDKGLAKKTAQVVKNTGYRFSDWQVVSQNGGLFMLSPDGTKLAITHADIHTGIQKYGNPEKIKHMHFYESHAGEAILEVRKRLHEK